MREDTELAELHDSVSIVEQVTMYRLLQTKKWKTRLVKGESLPLSKSTVDDSLCVGPCLVQVYVIV